MEFMAPAPAKRELAASERRVINVMLDRRFSPRQMKAAAGWMEQVPAKYHSDFELLFKEPAKNYLPSVHKSLARFFVNAKRQKWQEYHTANAFHVTALTLHALFKHPSVPYEKKISLTMQLGGSWKYLDSWVKLAAPKRSQEKEFKRLANGQAIVADAMALSGPAHTSAAHELLKEKDHLQYPLHLHAVARVRWLAEQLHEKFPKQYIADAKEPVVACQMTLLEYARGRKNKQQMMLINAVNEEIDNAIDSSKLLWK